MVQQETNTSQPVKVQWPFTGTVVNYYFQPNPPNVIDILMLYKVVCLDGIRFS